MNMNKVLAAGLIAAVASTASFAECGNGGFYVGLNAGMSFNKTKIKTAEDSVSNGTKITETITVDSVNKASGYNAASKAVAEAAKQSKSKGKFLSELILGYDFRMNDVMMGVDLTFGTQFGKQTLKAKSQKGSIATPSTATAGDKVDVLKIKEQWHIGLMPRIGYLFTPEFEGYVTFGVKFARFKATTIMNAITDVQNAYTSSTLPADPYNKSVSKSKMKVVPVVGAGVRYEFTPELFAKLEYNFDFRAKAKLHESTMPELTKATTQAHVVKLGLGYRF